MGHCAADAGCWPRGLGRCLRPVGEHPRPGRGGRAITIGTRGRLLDLDIVTPDVLLELRPPPRGTPPPPRPASKSMVSRKTKASTPGTVSARPASTSTVSLKTNALAASCTLYAHGDTGPGDGGMARPKTAWSLPRTGSTFTASRNKASTPRRQSYPVRLPCHLRVLNCQVCFIFLQFLNLVAGIVRGCCRAPQCRTHTSPVSALFGSQK